MGDVVVEKLIDVKAVCSLGRCGHSQPELRREISENLLIAQSPRLVDLVDYDVVEMVFGIPFMDFLLGHCLYGGENVILIELFGVPRNKTELFRVLENVSVCIY